MLYKWAGAVLILAGCGGFGFSLAAGSRRRERQLVQFLKVLDRMKCELRYRLTPLAELCMKSAEDTDGAVRKVMQTFSSNLEGYLFPDPASCMYKALEKHPVADRDIRQLLLELGRSFGNYDLEGQLAGMDRLREKCGYYLTVLREKKEDRIRCYEALGLCTGAALAILLV